VISEKLCATKDALFYQTLTWVVSPFPVTFFANCIDLSPTI